VKSHKTNKKALKLIEIPNTQMTQCKLEWGLKPFALGHKKLVRKTQRKQLLDFITNIIHNVSRPFFKANNLAP